MRSTIQYETISSACRTGFCKRKLVLPLGFLALDTPFHLEQARSQLFGLKASALETRPKLAQQGEDGASRCRESGGQPTLQGHGQPQSEKRT